MRKFNDEDADELSISIDAHGVKAASSTSAVTWTLPAPPSCSSSVTTSGALKRRFTVHKGRRLRERRVLERYIASEDTDLRARNYFTQLSLFSTLSNIHSSSIGSSTTISKAATGWLLRAKQAAFADTLTAIPNSGFTHLLRYKSRL